ncbi:hypothetical protein HOD19_03105 [bacterium]|jgi:hypothetical protein|nr:hypothetical protein [bacterium]
MCTLEETLQDSNIFRTYKLSLTMLYKSTMLLAYRGADPKAITKINEGIKMLSNQLAEHGETLAAFEELKTFQKPPDDSSENK